MRKPTEEETSANPAGKRKKRITKEELKKLLSYRKRLITLKRKAFSAVSKKAEKEYELFSPCEKCKFLKKDCHKTCGIIMKHLHSSGKVEVEESFGLVGRSVSEAEHLDTMGMNLGTSEEVDKAIREELNGLALPESEDIAPNDLSDYDISED